jgi:hypothetical protein
MLNIKYRKILKNLIVLEYIFNISILNALIYKLNLKNTLLKLFNFNGIVTYIII